ncbi:NAD(P)-binding domain-containing protein [Kitasatospora misakiensis]|uniref:NAD(P)-binding domain-containing protein n=1 Tax=Kitasatospora misakiensis TaxID=67330 RepID=A0ABW0X9M3_9ACTN
MVGSPAGHTDRAATASRRPDVPVTVVGAGPYGLAVAGHLKARGVPLRVLGEPMETWRERMPEGMYLKSVPRASSIADPGGRYRLEDFRAAEGQPPVGDGYAVPVDEFIRYGQWYQQQCVPELERRTVTAVAPDPAGFRLALDSGESFTSRAVVLANGFAPYAYLPPELARLTGPGLVSHSADHHDLTRFAGRRVAVVGAGQSALETAALLSEQGAQPTVVARTAALRFGTPPTTERGSDRPLPVRLAKPASLLGPGWSLLAFSRLPAAFRHLPEPTRTHFVRTVLGPAGAWWLRDRVEGRFPLLVGHRLRSVTADGDGVCLELADARGPGPRLRVDHVIAATGYRVRMDRLTVLDPALRQRLRLTNGAPLLDASFESGVPGLFFTGLAAAATFGPVMRFVAGTGFAARRIGGAIGGATGGSG